MAIITEEVGDIFDSPSNSILIHACNAKGVWGSGVAVEFKKRFPKAYREYHSHCLSKSTSPIDGTTLLIPTQTSVNSGKLRSERDNRYVACLFTSHGYGKAVDPPETILKNTKAALENLASQIQKLKAGKPEMELGGCRAVRINSGRFGVPWEETKKILEGGSLDMVIVRPEDGALGKVELGKRTSNGRTKRGRVTQEREEDVVESGGSREQEKLEDGGGLKGFQDDAGEQGDSDGGLPTKWRKKCSP